MVNTLVKHASTRGRIDVFGGEQWRPHVYVGDVSRAIVNVLDAPLDLVRSEIFNVGDSNQNYTINNISELVLDAFPGTEVKYDNVSVDPRNYRVDCSKLRDTLNFEIKTNVAQGISELKAVLDKGKLGNLDQPSYSNLQTIQDLAFQ